MVQEPPSSNGEVDIITQRYESLVAVKKDFVDDLQHKIHIREEVSSKQDDFENLYFISTSIWGLLE